MTAQAYIRRLVLDSLTTPAVATGGSEDHFILMPRLAPRVFCTLTCLYRLALFFFTVDLGLRHPGARVR